MRTITYFPAILILLATLTIALPDSLYGQAPKFQVRFPDLVYSVDISEDGKLIAAGSRGGTGNTLTVVDVETQTNLWSVNAGTWVWEVGFSSDQKHVVSASDMGLMVWDARKGGSPTLLKQPQKISEEVKHLALSPNGQFLAACRGVTIEIWDFPERQFISAIQTTGGGAVVFSGSSEYLVVAGEHNRVTLYEVASGKQVCEVHAMMGVLQAADYATDGNTLAVCSEGATKVFSVNQTGDQIELEQSTLIRSGMDIDISSDGKLLAVGGYQGQAQIYALDRAALLETLAVANGPAAVSTVKFSADNKNLILGGMIGRGPERSGFIQLWEIGELSK